MPLTLKRLKNLLSSLVFIRFKSTKKKLFPTSFFGYCSGLLRVVFGKMVVLPKVYRTRPEDHPNKTAKKVEERNKKNGGRIPKKLQNFERVSKQASVQKVNYCKSPE